MAVVQFVLGLKQPDQKVYKSTDAIANDVIKLLTTLTGHEIPNRWSAEDLENALESVTCLVA